MKDDVEFCLTDLPDTGVPANTVMVAENIDGRYFGAGEDFCFYRLSFTPMLEFAQFFPSESTHLATTLLRGFRTGNRQTPLFSVPLDGPVCQEERLPTGTLPTRIITFYCYPTHVVESTVSPDDPTRILIRYIYLTLANNQLSEAPNAQPQIELHVAMDTFYMPYCAKFVGLPFYPLDVHLRAAPYDIVFDPALVGQRVPFWFLQRGIVSGSSVGKYGAGYWAERDAKDDTFGPEARARMRQGRIMEPEVLLTYLHAHPGHTFHEQGYIVLASLNKDYGVSPDGLAITEHQERIALEFKVSAFSTKFPDYYIPQL
jgi:hypothetical protein